MQATTRYLVSATMPMAVITVTATIWAIFLLPAVPDPMAIHFGPDAMPDDYLSPGLNIGLLAGLSLLTIVGFGLVTRLGLCHGNAARLVAGAATATVTLLSGVLVGLFVLQQDLTDASAATLPAGFFWLVLGSAIGVGLLFAGLITPAPRTPTHVTTSAANDSGGRERTTFTATILMHISVRIILLLVTAMTIIFVFALPNWATVLTALVMVLAVWVTWGWRLRIDDTGLTYRSLAGMPRKHLPHNDIATSELIQVNPSDWGGWGWRKNTAGTGLITQAGPGIRITQTNGRILEISTDDAAAALEVLDHYHQPANSQ